MLELFGFLKSNAIGLVSLALALFLYRLSRISGLVAVKSHDVAMIGGGGAVYPDAVEVRYRGNPVPRLTRSTIWIWNAGKKTVRRSDIAEHDPLRLVFDGQVLNCRIRKLSREVTRIRANIEQEPQGAILCQFDFLDPGDGGVFEVLHSGSDEAPQCLGTVIGHSRSPRYWGSAGHGYASYGWKVAGVNFLAKTMGLALALLGIVLVYGALRALLVDATESDSGLSSWFVWFALLLGLGFASTYGHALWTLRRRFPSSLILGGSATDMDETFGAERQSKR